MGICQQIPATECLQAGVARRTTGIPDETACVDRRVRSTDRHRNEKNSIGGTMSVEEKISKIIIDQLGVSAEEVKPEASFVEDLGADSLDLTELIMAMEEEFGIEIDDDDAQKILKVQDAIAYIKNKQ
ncbi:Acyl carrier protein [anaerobic digester metagenome]